MRLFIALPISAQAQAALAERQKDLAAALTGWRWSAPENLHLTLAFLGETPEGKVPAIEGIVRRGCAGAQAFAAGFQGLDAFPSPRDPRVLYLNCAQGKDRIDALARGLLPDLISAGLVPEAEKGRAFQAHLSLARRQPRLAGISAAADLKSLLAEDKNRPAVISTIDRVVLYQSRPSASGPQYLPMFAQGLTEASI